MAIDKSTTLVAVALLVAPAAAHAQNVSQVWTAFYVGGQRSSPSGMAVDASRSRIYVTGTTFDHGALTFDTVAYDTDTGTELWVARYGDPANINEASALAMDGAGNLYVTGRIRDNAGPVGYYATVAYDPTGRQLWAARFRAGLDADPTAIIVDRTGNVYVTGFAEDASFRINYVTVAYSAWGVQRWVAIYGGPKNVDFATAIAVDGLGGIYVTGRSAGSGGGAEYDYATVAYASESGARRWVRRYHGSVQGSSDIASAIVADGRGSVYVTGRSQSAELGDEYATLAYDAATGVQRWLAEYTETGVAGAKALALDPFGRLYVTGEDSDAMATVAYDTATGASQWVARYEEPGYGETARDIVVDGTGAVYVTGSRNGSGSSEPVTLAYDAASGADHWQIVGEGERVSPTGKIRTDGLGTVYVTGENWDGVSGPSYYETVAYAVQ